MPRIPNKTIEASTPQLLNAIRNDLGAEYQAMVPEAIAGETGIARQRALERLREIGEALRTYPTASNLFLNALINRIGRVILSSRLYRNPWAFFKRGFLEYGETIEEIFVNLIDSMQYDPEGGGEKVFAQYKNDVRSAFHVMNYQKVYPLTVNESMLYTAFLSYEGVVDLVSKLMESIYTSANYDELLMTRYLVAKAIIDGRMAPIVLPELNKANSEDIVIKMKETSGLLSYMATDFNEAGVTTYSDNSSQYFILNTAFTSVIDVAVLARAYNLDKVEFMARTVPINTFKFSGIEEARLKNLIYPEVENAPALFTSEQQAILDSVPGVLVDKNWFMIFDNMETMRSIENPEKLYWNYFYHVWKTFSISPFNNAVCFTTTTPTITSVSITPSTATLAKSTQTQFTANVTGTGVIRKNVIWSINSDVSFVSDTGLVTISGKETATTLTLTATSVEDSTKSGTATITIE